VGKDIDNETPMGKKSAEIIDMLRKLGDREIALHSQRFFKTGPGEYGEGDIFLGIRVPVIRGCVREYRDIGLAGALELLASPLHEVRLFALIAMVDIYRSAKGDGERQACYDAYLGNTAYINNWDLVDCSAEHIGGAHLFERDRSPLYTLSHSNSLWERRIAIMATFHFIRKGDFGDTLAISGILLNDREDLIHKAVGWMLREVGKRDMDAEKGFLDRNYGKMPRTMLRYAIERFPQEERLSYLHAGRKTDP
jgi:3-methyladenine DNA glycosylase AlkD